MQNSMTTYCKNNVCFFFNYSLTVYSHASAIWSVSLHGCFISKGNSGKLFRHSISLLLLPKKVALWFSTIKQHTFIISVFRGAWIWEQISLVLLVQEVFTAAARVTVTWRKTYFKTVNHIAVSQGTVSLQLLTWSVIIFCVFLFLILPQGALHRALTCAYNIETTEGIPFVLCSRTVGLIDLFYCLFEVSHYIQLVPKGRELDFMS